MYKSQPQTPALTPPRRVVHSVCTRAGEGQSMITCGNGLLEIVTCARSSDRGSLHESLECIRNRRGVPVSGLKERLQIGGHRTSVLHPGSGMRLPQPECDGMKRLAMNPCMRKPPIPGVSPPRTPGPGPVPPAPKLGPIPQ